MRPVITAAEAARVDAASSVPDAELMERAGLAVAIAAGRMGVGYGSRVVVLAGVGNNGGDGYVAARHLLDRGVDVVVRSLAYPKGDVRTNREMAIAASKAGVPIDVLGDPEPADLIIDALFGIGFTGALPDRVLPWLDHPAPVLAVDVPSGLDATTGLADGPAFRADTTVTFHALKTGHLVGQGPDHCGTVEVVDIGLDGGDAEWLLCEDADAAVPARPRAAHKWSAGSVAVVGGAPGMVGAPMLAGRSALAFGAGAAKALLPGSLRAEGATMDPGVMTDGIGSASLHDDADTAVDAASRFDVLILGPGLGDTGEFAATLAASFDGPIVVDADALTAGIAATLKARTAPTVVTPHAAEFERLAGEPGSPEAAARFADEHGVVVLLKGAPTFVMGDQRWVVTSGGPELATIGTGDVLAGMIAALLARGMDPDHAARAAAHRHGAAAAALAASTTVTATGLAEEIGRFAW